MSTVALALDQWRAELHSGAGLGQRQLARLRGTVAHARRHSPFYTDHYRHVSATTWGLVDLPPVTKPVLMEHFDDWVTDPKVSLADVRDFMMAPGNTGRRYLDKYFVCTTSGTTGHPGVFLYDPQACAVFESFSFRIDRRWLSLPQWAQLAKRGGRWAAVVGTGAPYAGAGWMEFQRQQHRRKHRTYRVMSAQAPIPQIVAELNAFDPAILTGYPSVLELLADEGRAGRLRINPVIVELSGESSDEDSRERISSGIGCAPHDVYACSEFLIMAFDCPSGRLHVNADWVILEPVERDYSPTPLGQPSHTVLLTNLGNQVQPVLRYDLGDSVLMDEDDCPCGNPLPSITVQGRRDDVVRFTDPSGQVVALPPLALGSVSNEVAGVRRAQLVQTSSQTLNVRLVCEPGTDADRIWEAVRSKLNLYLTLQGLTNIEVVRDPREPETSPGGGKFRQVIAA